MFTNAITIGNWSWSLTAKVFTKCLFVFEHDLDKQTKLTSYIYFIDKFRVHLKERRS